MSVQACAAAPRAMADTDGFGEASYAVQWKTTARPNTWEYYSNFKPNPKDAQMDYKNARENPNSIDTRIVMRIDERFVIELEELQQEPPCSRKECRKLPTPNEGGRIYRYRKG